MVYIQYLVKYESNSLVTNHAITYDIFFIHTPCNLTCYCANIISNTTDRISFICFYFLFLVFKHKIKPMKIWLELNIFLVGTRCA